MANGRIVTFSTSSNPRQTRRIRKGRGAQLTNLRTDDEIEMDIRPNEDEWDALLRTLNID